MFECARQNRNEEILEVLQKEPRGMTAAQIAEQLGLRAKSVQNRITQMVKEQVVTLIGKQGSVNVYGCDRELLAV